MNRGADSGDAPKTCRFQATILADFDLGTCPNSTRDCRVMQWYRRVIVLGLRGHFTGTAGLCHARRV